MYERFMKNYANFFYTKFLSTDTKPSKIYGCLCKTALYYVIGFGVRSFNN